MASSLHVCVHYVPNDKIIEYEYLPATRTFVENYRKRSITGPVPKYCIGFSFIHSEDYGLYLNLGENKMKKNRQITTPKKNPFVRTL